MLRISISKTLTSILGFSDSDGRRHPHPHRWPHLYPSPEHCGLHILAADSPKLHNVLESPSIRPTAAPGDGKTADPGSWGLHDACPPGCGIGICTESLGCESCEIRIDDDKREKPEIGRWEVRRQSRRRTLEVRFPPPLSWMFGRGGRTSRFLKAERRDGRFVLTEMRIDPQPEMLRAFRSDGRLRLKLVGSEQDVDGSAIENSKADIESITVDGEVEVSSDRQSEENGERWELPRVRSEGQRCVEVVSGNGAAPLWWNHRFMTTV
ncbi:hypothetical protein HPP92_011509 [Vanilla planifolia]|uniref:FAF domain-containing protein n=1 Tax=Vanilla planifolia TaxID=51239 RepID=A0A835R0Y5_VANPL|nr:hypothetical protein HPP92_011509 [Vanilla planifolia]